MIYLKAQNVKDATKLIEQNPHFSLLFGGSDLALKVQKNTIEGIIDISHLQELSYIRESQNSVEIGSLTTINTILNNEIVKKHLAILAEASQNFASYQIRNIASIGGNIANASPVADLIAPLLVLNARVTLVSTHGERTILLEDLYSGYKSLNLKNELIKSFTITLKTQQHYYRKVGPRKSLNISKLSLAIVKNEDGFFISGASLNPYISRFKHLETLLNTAAFSDDMIREAISKDISPSGSYRSTKEYRSRVLFNMLKDALLGFKK